MVSDSWKLHHVGHPVADLDKAIEFYKLTGIGKIEPEFVFDSDSKLDHRVYGKPISMKYRVQFIRIDVLPVELVQPLGRGSVHDEFLDNYGDGINHIGYVVEDLEKETERMVALGFPVILSFKHKESGGVVYLDTREKFGGLCLELMSNPQHGNT